ADTEPPRPGFGATGSPTTPGPRSSPPPATSPAPPPRYGNPRGQAMVPADARAVDTSRPTRIIGNGTPSTCTSAAAVAAVAARGIIRFSCGPAPVTIALATTAKVVNARPAVVLDGGGLVTLSGGGRRRILYLNTCDRAQGWTTSHCQDQQTPQLTVQNISFV